MDKFTEVLEQIAKDRVVSDENLEVLNDFIQNRKETLYCHTYDVNDVNYELNNYICDYMNIDIEVAEIIDEPLLKSIKKKLDEWSGTVDWEEFGDICHDSLFEFYEESEDENGELTLIKKGKTK